MKKAKLILMLVIIGLIVLFVFQNQAFIKSTHSFRINLFLIDEYHTPNIPNAVLFLGCFLIGFLIAYFLSLVHRFSSGKMIKNLKETIKLQEKDLSDLKSRLDGLTADAAADDGDDDLRQPEGEEG